MARRAIGLVPPPPLRNFTAIPKGPKLYNQPPLHQGGPGEPPPGFLGSHTTLPEWFAYWALWQIFGLPLNPRLPPFFGAPPIWTYQDQQQTGASQGGLTRIDFVVNPPSRGAPIAIRIQTEYFHQFTDAATQAYDVMQQEALEAYSDVIDVVDQDIMGDPTGAKAVVTMKRAVGLLQNPNPIISGTAIRASSLKDRL